MLLLTIEILFSEFCFSRICLLLMWKNLFLHHKIAVSKSQSLFITLIVLCVNLFIDRHHQSIIIVKLISTWNFSEDWFSIDEKPPIAHALLEILEGADLKPSDLNGEVSCVAVCIYSKNFCRSVCALNICTS